MDRSLLQALLSAITPKVYYQPPANVQMEYPCIVYQRDFIDTRFAGNAPYNNTTRYAVTVISRSPDDDIVNKLARLPLCSYDRSYVADGLHHDVFRLYF